MQDVLVIGFGPAGAAAAIAAHDAGARVEIHEKTAEGGGNARYAGGFLLELEREGGLEHLEALCFGKTPRDVLKAYLDGLQELPAALESLGGHAPHCDFPLSWPHFPGTVRYRRIEDLWGVLSAEIERRGIEVAYESPVTSLDTAGSVVLATGSFEYDEDLRDAHLPLPLVAVGNPANTGDGLRMAQAAGASLWHMSACFGWFAFRHPDHVAAFPLDVHAPSFIHVDADGRRFADETGWEIHDRLRALTAYLPRRANRPALPGHLIFDERARLAGPLNGLVGTPNDYAWSADNSRELEAGWIVPAERLGLPHLAETLARYGETPDEFGRVDPVALEPPLYAIETWPAVATCSGGPRRDGRARVLRRDGTPIEGLYAAGCGSLWGHLTEHGGGLTEALVFGEIAGREAATVSRSLSGQTSS